MAGLRGPDSSKDAQLLDERAVFPETVDVNIRQLDPIPAPRYFLKELPLTNEMSDLVLKSRQEIRDVLHGRDDRLLAIVGDEPMMRARLFRRSGDAAWSSVDVFDTVAPRLQGFDTGSRFVF